MLPALRSAVASVYTCPNAAQRRVSGGAIGAVSMICCRHELHQHQHQHQHQRRHQHNHSQSKQRDAPTLQRPKTVQTFVELRGESGRPLRDLSVVSTNYLHYYKTPKHLPVLIGHRISYALDYTMLFENVSFSLRPGGALLLQGSNGSGKTTLLNIIAGLKQPFSGNIVYETKNCDKGPLFLKPYELHNGNCIFLEAYDSTVSGDDTCKSAILAAIHFYSAATNLDDVLDLMHLSNLKEQKIETMSTGQAKRVQLARLVAAPAPVWILDEPTIALDTFAIGLLEAIIRNHRRRGGIVIVASHANINLENAVSLRIHGSSWERHGASVSSATAGNGSG